MVATKAGEDKTSKSRIFRRDKARNSLVLVNADREKQAVGNRQSINFSLKYIAEPTEI